MEKLSRDAAKGLFDNDAVDEAKGEYVEENDGTGASQPEL